MTLPFERREEPTAGGHDIATDPDLPVSLAAHRPRWRTEELGGLVALYGRRHAALQAARRVEAEDQRLQAPSRVGTIGRGSPEHAAATGRWRPSPAGGDGSLSGVRLSLKRVLGAPHPAVRLRRPR